MGKGGQPMGVVGDIHALDGRFASWARAVEEAGGECSPEMEAEFESIAADAESAADQLARWKRNAEARSEGYLALAKVAEAEGKRLRNLARIEENSASFAEARLADVLGRLGMRKLRTSMGTASVCVAAPRVVVEGEIPEGFRQQKVEWVLDREAVLEAEEQGCLPDAIRVERKVYVRFSAAREEKKEVANADAVS